MDQLTLIIVIGTMNLLCFYFGAKIGQKVISGKEVKIIENPIDAFKEHKEKEKQEEENKVLDVIQQNIDAYDGTPYGQKDIPR